MVHNEATTAAASVTTLFPYCKPKKVKDKKVQNSYKKITRKNILGEIIKSQKGRKKLKQKYQPLHKTSLQ